MEINIPEEVTKTLIDSKAIYFAGRNNGVAEELTLKANEIARKKSDFLEGTYIFHTPNSIIARSKTMNQS